MDLAAFGGVVRRRWIALLLCLMAGIGGAVAITDSTPSTYQASTRLFVNIPAARGIAEALQGVQLTAQLLKSYGEIATSSTAVQRIVEKLHLPVSEGPLRSRLSATPEVDTQIIRISADDRDPGKARTVADAAATVFVDLINELEQGKDGAIQARIIDPAVLPTRPISPRPSSNLATGALLGVVVGLLTVGLLEALDRTVKTLAQAAEVMRAPLLGVVPKRREASVEPLILTGDTRQGAEAYRSLRTAVRFVEAATPLRTLLVTSAQAAEGKTTTAANLAIAFAQSGERVILVDADMRRTQLADIFGLPSAPGLSSVVRHELPASEALQGWRSQLAVMTGGPLPPNPSEVLGSQGMAEAVNALKGMADIVIFDAPPVLPVTDAEVLSTLVDGVLMIAWAGKTDRGGASEARRRLDVVGANVIGCVLNAARASLGEGYYLQYYRSNQDDDRARRSWLGSYVPWTRPSRGGEAKRQAGVGRD